MAAHPGASTLQSACPTLTNRQAWLLGLLAAVALALLVLQVPYSALNGRFAGCMVVCPLLGGWLFGLLAVRARRAASLLLGLVTYLLVSLVYFPWFVSTPLMVRVIGISATGGSHGLVEGLVARTLCALVLAPARLLQQLGTRPVETVHALVWVPALVMGGCSLLGAALGRRGRLRLAWRVGAEVLALLLLASVTVLPAVTGPRAIARFGARRGDDVAAVVSRNFLPVPRGLEWEWEQWRPREQSALAPFRLPPPPVAGITMRAAWTRDAGQPAPGRCELEVQLLATPARGLVGGDVSEVSFSFTRAPETPPLSEEALTQALGLAPLDHWNLSRGAVPPDTMALARHREFLGAAPGCLCLAQSFE